MAFQIKNTNRPQGSSTPMAILDQFIKVSCVGLTNSGVALPATTTGQIFRVFNGRILVKALVAEVTTAIQAQACNVKFTAKKLDGAGVAIGTAVDITANVDVTGQAVGSHHFVEGDGTAGVLSTAGAVLMGTNTGWWVCEQGEIYLTTSATNTGAYKYDLYYQPLDPGAYAVQAQLSGAGILQAAI